MTYDDVIVTDADREAAAQFIAAMKSGGLGDGVSLAERFARHRIAALEEAASVAEHAHYAQGTEWTPSAIARHIRALTGPQPKP